MNSARSIHVFFFVCFSVPCPNPNHCFSPVKQKPAPSPLSRSVIDGMRWSRSLLGSSNLAVSAANSRQLGTRAIKNSRGYERTRTEYMSQRGLIPMKSRVRRSRRKEWNPANPSRPQFCYPLD
ncbi:hypothetical protein BDW71DRAFT_81832 [Aspergillus fruticulosus]